MLDKEKEIQKILKGKFMEGPKLLMNENSIGINCFSGDTNSAYYELYGNKSIFRLVIIQPTLNLFTDQYVGKDHLLFLLLDEKQVRGGFVQLKEKDLLQEFTKVFLYLSEGQIEELHSLWTNFISLHYSQLSNS